MSNTTTLRDQSSKQTDDEDDDNNHHSKTNSALPAPNAKLSVEQAETRYITITEAIGLDFNSFIPQADITSQVHFISNIQPDSQAGLAGLKDGDRILQINGVNVTNLEHEDVRKLMQLMTPIVLTVAYDSKYLLLLQQPVHDIEEKQPELPITSSDNVESDTSQRRVSRFELKKSTSLQSGTSSSTTSSTTSGSRKSSHYEIYQLTPSDETTKEGLKVKVCRLRKSRHYDGYGLVLRSQQHLHVVGGAEEASPSYRAGLRENDVILFVGKSNVEKLAHDDVKVMIRAAALASSEVELTVISKLDIPRYKTLQEKGLVDWSQVGLER